MKKKEESKIKKKRKKLEKGLPLLMTRHFEYLLLHMIYEPISLYEYMTTVLLRL